jgi:hypothetical protein
LKTSLSVGALLFTIFGIFAFSFYFGTILVINEHSNSIRIVSQNQRFEIVKYDEKRFHEKLINLNDDKN